MKKYTKKEQHLRHNRRHARRSNAARLRFLRYRAHKNTYENRLSEEERKLVRKRKQHVSSGFTDVEAPKILSFIRNPEEVSKFVAELRACFEKRRPVFVALRNVEDVDLDGITVLLSVVVRFKARRIKFNGDFPTNKSARKTLHDSGFFDHLNDKFKDNDQYSLVSPSSIFTHAQKNVDSPLGAKIIESAALTVWGAKRRCPGVQRVFIELMQNTNNHASPLGEGEKHWWLCVKHNRAERKVAFSFVDYGVGVFHSLYNKKAGSKFYGAINRLMDNFKIGNEGDVLKKVFEGELHRTSTGRSYRGKGLPGVYQALNQGQIRNLALITNKVFFNSTTNHYLELENEFQGTFIFWEIDENNSSLAEI